MARILVSGLINIETTLRVDGFPLAYHPVNYAFDRVHSSVSGVGFNVAKALRTLGHDVVFLSLVGRDPAADLARAALRRCGVADTRVLGELAATPQSVILYDAEGRRQIHVDLKDIQQRAYPLDVFDEALAACDAAALCNINFSRPFLARARAAGKLLATGRPVVSTIGAGDALQSLELRALASIATPGSGRTGSRRSAGGRGTLRADALQL